MSDAGLEKLFNAFDLADLQLKNRIVMPAMTTNFGNGDGSVSERLVEYYKARAGGGAGMVIVEPACVEYPRGKGLMNELDISTDDAIPGLGKLAAAIKSCGAAAAVQLHHAGWLRFHCEPIVAPPVAPSPLRYRGADTPHELTVAQIGEVIDNYANAAVRARKTGFDAVEIHGAHGYLIAQFLSPRTNQRTDAYGGDPAGRARLLLEVIEAIRRRTGPGFPILVRIDAEEFVEGGISIERSCRLARRLEQAGADAIHVTVNSTPAKSTREIISNVPPMGSSEGTWVHLAEQIKNACSLAVIAVGNIRTPAFMEELLQSGKADLVAVGRQFIADPQWPAKVRAGKAQKVRPCIACNSCIRSVTSQKSSLVCAVNAAAGREDQLPAPAPVTPRRILVLGGGPAGMQAAAEAARRGHHVELWERENDLGGQLHLAAVPPEKENLLKLLDFLKGQMRECGVSVSCRRFWTTEDVSAAMPDVVIVAVGSRESVPPLVRSAACCNVVTARQVLAGEVVTGRNILIVGGGAVGCEVADYLRDGSRSICIVEQKPMFAPDMDPMRRRKLLLRITEAGVQLRKNTRLLRMTSKGGEIASLEGVYELIEADTVVHAGAPAPRKVDTAALGTPVTEVYTIGDALKSRGILEAVMEGWMIGNRI